MSLFEPIEPIRISDSVVRQVRRMIVRGDLKPGERLPPERELSKVLSVSRSALREGLRILERLGLVEVKPGAGTFVVEEAWKADGGALWIPWLIEHREQLIELLEAREFTEAETARLAAMRLSDEKQGELRRIHAELRSCVQNDFPAEAVRWDLAFHEQIWEATNNRYLANLAKSFYEAFHDARRSFFSVMPRIRTEVVEEHEAVLRALLGRNPEQAYVAMRSHISNFRHSIATLIEQADASPRD